MARIHRVVYEKATGLKIPSSFDIHHIDLDKKNNHINNLVALPKRLHQDYHNLLSLVEYDIPKALHGNIFNTIEDIQTFLEVYKICCAWVNYRDHLLNKIIPNLYNLSYEYAI